MVKRVSPVIVMNEDRKPTADFLKEACFKATKQIMEKEYERDVLPRACINWAIIGAEIVQEVMGQRAIIQAGTMQWPIIRMEEDDGVSDSHLTYLWTKPTAADPLGYAPEMHAWIAIPGTNEIIDFTTSYVPEQCRRIVGKEFRGEKPPAYLWAKGDDMPAGVLYQADREAIQWVLDHH